MLHLRDKSPVSSAAVMNHDGGLLVLADCSALNCQSQLSLMYYCIVNDHWLCQRVFMKVNLVTGQPKREIEIGWLFKEGG